MPSKETYISFDIEADGPIPGKYSMLSLGAVALDETGKEIGSFYVNFLELDGAIQDPDTMNNFWAHNKEAWAALMINRLPPLEAITKFRDWLRGFDNPVLVAFPAGFDFTFVYWYLIYFLGSSSPISWSCIDIKTMAFCNLKIPFKKCTKNKFPIHWDTITLHNHIAIDDAREQGELFSKILKDIKNACS